jgi:hypothetical protein
MSDLRLRILQEARRYIDKLVSKPEFQDWYAPLSWNIEATRDEQTISIVHEIDGVFGEASSAEWAEEELREELARTIRPFERLKRLPDVETSNLKKSALGVYSANQRNVLSLRLEAA